MTHATNRTETERSALRERVRALIASKPITVDLATREAQAMDALLDALLELVLQHIYDQGGFCDYEWHISGADFSGGLRKDPTRCMHCGRTREEHFTHPILLCPDEFELVKRLDAEAKR